MHLTTKQIEILGIVVKGNGTNDAGKLIQVDLDQIIERVSYTVTKEAIQFSIRGLIKRGLIEKDGTENRRDRRRVLFTPTDLGRGIFTADVNPSFIEPDEEVEVI